MDLHEIIIRPFITEKTMKDAKQGKFTFQVSKSATKHTIRKAVEEVFKVDVKGVATSTIKGRTKRVGVKRTEIKEPSFKKAIVRLAKGQKIDLFETSSS